MDKTLPPTASPSPPAARFDLRSRATTALVHLAASAAVAALAALAVFGLWYPEPFREISGGRELFMLIVSVDIVIGPLITFAVFDRRKPLTELRRDLAIVVALQLAALSYGLHTVYEARPIVLALEGDRRLRVVRAIDLDRKDLQLAPAGLRELPLWGRRLVATRAPTTPEESLEAIQLAFAGVDIGMRPDFWLAPDEAPAALRRSAKPLADLRRRYPARVAELDERARATGRAMERLGYLPLLARRSDWVALIDLDVGEIVAYAPFDGF